MGRQAERSLGGILPKVFNLAFVAIFVEISLNEY
jgi:hypothetical protein